MLEENSEPDLSTIKNSDTFNNLELDVNLLKDFVPVKETSTCPDMLRTYGDMDVKMKRRLGE